MTMKCTYACGSSEHLVHRRKFLGDAMLGLSAAGLGAAGLGFLARPAAAKELASQQKRVLVFYMSGGLSQLESWDPKPGADTGGPFRAIQTSVPGTQISELLPLTAPLMHKLSIVRSVNTREDDHGKGRYLMVTGRRQTPASNYPEIGAVLAKALSPAESPLPGHIQISPGGGGGRGNDAAYLGPKYSSIVLGGGAPPQNTLRPDSIPSEEDLSRNDFRRKLNSRFASRRRTAQTDAYTYSYEQAVGLMQKREIFDVTKESAADHERYGKHDLGQQCLLARRLLENEISYVQVSHSNYDTHNENFDFHLEQLGEFDRSFSTLIADLSDRGLLESTLVVVMSEFGRTPGINHLYGRDHWGTAWSVLLAGARIQPGAVIGKTNDRGTEVIDREVDHGHLFHTYLQAVGLDSKVGFDIDGREIPMADPAYDAISEILA